MMGDGQTSYDLGNDGEGTQIGACSVSPTSCEEGEKKADCAVVRLTFDGRMWPPS